jgi:hypothetical protein
MWRTSDSDRSGLQPACWLQSPLRPAQPAPAVTYWKHIPLILFEYFAPCHRPDVAGGFSLLTYEDARKRAGLIADVTPVHTSLAARAGQR